MVLSTQAVLHPDGLSPVESVKAWYLHTQEGYGLGETALEVLSMKGDTPGLKALRGAFGRVTSSGAVETKYKNCGRKRGLYG